MFILYFLALHIYILLFQSPINLSGFQIGQRIASEFRKGKKNELIYCAQRNKYGTSRKE
jgi:mannose/fructose/N-acetylgalactosamine-specific phosphotransferase system component IID